MPRIPPLSPTGVRAMESWKIDQLSFVKQEVMRFLSGEKLRLCATLFEHLIARKIQQAEGKEAAYLTDQDIAKYLYPGGDPNKTDNNVRVKKSDLSRVLESFFDSTPGRKLPMVVSGPTRPETPALISEKNNLLDLDVHEKDCALKRFWKPYFCECTRVHIVYGENVFFRTGKDTRIFIRHLDVNDEKDCKGIQKRCGMPSKSWWQGGRQFTSSGDCAAVVDLVQGFERNGLQTNVIRAAALEGEGWRPGKKEGLVLLGNGRVIPWIPECLENEKFSLQIESKRIKDSRRQTNPNDNFREPSINGIVARTFSKNLNCWLTIITANHGRFCEAAVQCFSSEHDLARVFEARRWESLPNRFEFEAKVNLTRLEEPQKKPGFPTPFDVITDPVPQSVPSSSPAD